MIRYTKKVLLYKNIHLFVESFRRIRNIRQLMSGIEYCLNHVNIIVSKHYCISFLNTRLGRACEGSIAQKKGEAMTEKIELKEAAELLGVSVPCLRERMRRGIYPIGLYASKKETGGKRDIFEVYRSKLYKFVGKEEE